MKFPDTQWSGELKLDFYDEQYKYVYELELKNLNREKPVWIQLRNNNPTRTDLQNARYWVYMELISRECGGTKEAWHKYFSQSFLIPKVETLPNGKVIEHEITTTTLTTIEFNEYMKEVENETGILLPPVYDY